MGVSVVATLSLTALWINLLSTGEAISGQSSDRGFESTAEGDVKTMAGGRQRSITTDGVRSTFSFTIVLLTLAQVQTLESWIGRPVQIRDHRGQRVFAVFYGVTRIEQKEPALYDAAIVAKAVTVAEGV